MIQDGKGQTGCTAKHPLVFSGFLSRSPSGYAVCVLWLQKIGCACVRGCNTVWYGMR